MENQLSSFDSLTSRFSAILQSPSSTTSIVTTTYALSTTSRNLSTDIITVSPIVLASTNSTATFTSRASTVSPLSAISNFTSSYGSVSSSTASTSFIEVPQTTASTSTPETSIAGQASTQNASSNPNFSTTVFAGAVAGSFVAGALVGLIFLALLKKRSQRSRYTSHASYAPVNDYSQTEIKSMPLVSVTAVNDDSHLPQQAEDAEVKRRILNLTDQIDQHVENFYTAHNNISFNASVETSVSQYETRQMPNPLSVCFEMATYPHVLIKHCLAFHVFSQTVAPGEDAQLILPTDILDMVGTMYPKSLCATTSKETLAAFSTWKQLTGYLLPVTVTSMRSSENASDAAMKFAQDFVRAFSAWADPQYSEEHRTFHLAVLVDNSIETAAWLFRQPDTYIFSWNTLTSNIRGVGGGSTLQSFAREVVLVPEVSKVSHGGQMLSGRGQNIVQAVVRRF